MNAKHIKTLVFDVDDTLYPKSLGLHNSGWERLLSIFNTNKKEEFGIGHLSADDYKTHGDDLLRKQNNFNWDGFMGYICDQDISSIEFNHNLKESLKKLPHKKIIYTDADYRHMHRVLEKLSISDLFTHKFSCADGNYHFKPYPESFNAFFQKTKINPHESAFFEDTKKNLKAAKTYGMMTILISEETEKPEYCDFVFRDVESALKIFE